MTRRFSSCPFHICLPNRAPISICVFPYLSFLTFPRRSFFLESDIDIAFLCLSLPHCRPFFSISCRKIPGNGAILNVLYVGRILLRFLFLLMRFRSMDMVWLSLPLLQFLVPPSFSSTSKLFLAVSQLDHSYQCHDPDDAVSPPLRSTLLDFLDDLWMNLILRLHFHIDHFFLHRYNTPISRRLVAIRGGWWSILSASLLCRFQLSSSTSHPLPRASPASLYYPITSK